MVGIDGVFVGGVRAVRPAPAAVFHVGGGEKIISFTAIGCGPTCVIVGDLGVAEGVAGFGKVEAGEDTQGAGEILVLELKQPAALFGRERNGIGLGEERGGFGVSGRVVGDTQQVITQRIR